LEKWNTLNENTLFNNQTKHIQLEHPNIIII